MRARSAFVTALLLASLSASTARAQAATDAQADAWIEEGIRLRSERRDAEALGLFRRAWEATQSAEARAQVALAEQALGAWEEAERDLVAALADERAPWITRHRVDLDAALAEIRRHLGSLEVRSPTPGATVRINASEPRALPLAAPLRLVVGTAHVEVSAAGFSPARREVEVRAGDDLLETFELVPLTAATPAAVTPRVLRAPRVVAPPPSPLAVWGTRALITGGALVALGAASLVWREVAAGEFNALDRTPRCAVNAADGQYGGPLCVSLYRQATAAEAIAITGFVVGGVAALTGLALLVAAPARPRSTAFSCAPGLRSVGCVVTF